MKQGSQNHHRPNSNAKKNKYRKKRKLLAKKEFDCMAAAREILKQEFMHGGHPKLRYWNDDFFLWDGTKYNRFTNSELKAEVLTWLCGYVEKASPFLYRQVAECLETLTFLSPHVTLDTFISSGKKGKFLATSIGILDLDAAVADRANVLLPLTSDWFSTSAVDYRYVKGARRPNFDDAVKKCFPNDPDSILRLGEMMGCMLTDVTKYNSFFVFYGKGANGKSVLVNVIESMLGPENCSAVPLELFGERFQKFSTFGKKLNICSDVGSLKGKAGAELKPFTSGDPISFERKFKDPFKARPTAKVLIVTNNHLEVEDKSGAFFRRMEVLHFLEQIPKSEQNVDYLDHTSPDWPFRDELPEILNFSIDGLRRLMKNGRFTKSAIGEAAKLECMSQNMPAERFLNDHCIVSTNAKIVKSELYEAYREWAEDNGYVTISNSVFGKKVKEVFEGRVTTSRVVSKKNRVSYHQGIQFKNNEGEENE